MKKNFGRKKMKIVHLCLIGTVTDGWNYQDNLLTKHHKEMGNEVTLITSKWIRGTDGKLTTDERSDYINQDGVRVIRLSIRGGEDFKRRFKRYKDLAPVLEQQAPDILFIHGVAFRDAAVVVKYLKRHPEVTAYADNHADLTNSGTNWLSKNVLHKIIWRHYAQALCPYVKKYYGVLPARVDFLVEQYGLPKNKCELLVMGADDTLVEKAKAPGVRQKIRSRHGIKQDDFLVMTGGKIDAWKTQTLLLMQAVQGIDRPDVRLIVFGSVADDLKEKVAALADGKKVQYIGWVQAEQSYEYFAAADLVVFPGRHSVFWEQVAGQGIPMIVKYLPGTQHVDLGGNVCFLMEDSTQEIQGRIQDLIDHPEQYQKMKKTAQEKGMQVFSYREIAKRAIQ